MGKNILILIANLLLMNSPAYSDVMDQYGILRKEDGSIRNINQYRAMGLPYPILGDPLPDPTGPACPENTHLPTIRELAELSQSLGAKGILEISEVTGEPPAGYYRIHAKNPDGSEDHFYYNSEGFKTPPGFLRAGNLWSSSIIADNKDGYKFAYFLSVFQEGYVGAVYRTYMYGHVFCAKDK